MSSSPVLTDRTPLAQTLRQADACIQHGKTRQAIQLLTKVLKHLPTHPHAHSRLGVLRMQVGQTNEAIRHFQTACTAQPKVLFHWVRLLSAYQQIGDVQRAKDVLAHAAQHNWPEQTMAQLAEIAMAPTGQRQHNLLALYQSGQDQLTTEIAARLFLDDYPDHPLGWQILGALLHDNGRLTESLDIKQQTVARFPQDANAHNNLSHTLLALERYEEALQSAQTALKLNPALMQARNHARLARKGLDEMQRMES